jgi:gliding motility-associated-like protein
MLLKPDKFMKLSAILLILVWALSAHQSTAQIVVIQDLECNGDSGGSFLIVPDFGAPPYTYIWNTGAFTPDITNLSAGTYSVTVTDTFLISQVYSQTLFDPPQIIITTDSLENVNCNGMMTGAIHISVAGGTTPYSFTWIRDGFFYSNSEDIVNIPAGIYNLIVTDANGCNESAVFTITETATPVLVTLVSTNATCFGGNDGSAIASGLGGTGTLNYLWSTSDITPDISGLTAGFYSVTVTDSLLCEATANIEILQPEFPIQITLVQNDVLCYGDSTGSIEVVHVSGANGPITYQWSNGGNTNLIDNLISGNYSVTVTDNNLCSAASATFISQSPQISVIPLITPSTCDGHNNGAISLNVSGGIMPYSFLWREIHFDSTYTTQNISNIRGGDYLLTITDSVGCVFSDTLSVPNIGIVPVNIIPVTYVCNGLQGSVSLNAPEADSAYYFNYSWSSTYNSGSFTTNDSVFTTSTGFLAGSYTITVTNNQTGCAHYFDFTINQSETPLTVAEVVNHNQCYDNTNGSIQLFPSGGDPLPAYQVTWSGPNGYTSTAFSISGLAVGDYHYSVSDDLACVVNGTVRIEPVLPLQGYISSFNVDCFGSNTGSAQAIFSGGTGLLNYSWSNGGTSQVITSLTAGTYVVTVTDSLGCQVIDSTAVIQPPGIFISTDSIYDVTCFGYSDGNILLTTGGGTGTLEYSWLHNGNIFPQVTEDIINIPAGLYQLTITDSLGCISSEVFNVIQPEETTFNESVHFISCNNGADGFWEITPAGFDHPYVGIFSTGDTISTDTVPAFLISGLVAGYYECVITSVLGCEWTLSLFLEQPLPITVGLADIHNVICKGDSTGSITLDAVHGGTSPYTYNWNNGMSANQVSELPAGIYNVTITDSNSCSIHETYEITEPYEWIKYFPTVINTSCIQSEDGMVILYPEDIYWSPFSNTFFLYDSLGVLIDSAAPGIAITDLQAGLYVTVLISEFGCIATDTIYIGSGKEDCILIPNLVTPNGDGYNDVFTVKGGCYYDEFFVQIFTDWGAKVFESSDCAFGWNPLDNKAAANTVYFYYIRVKEKNKIYEFKSSIDIKY